MMGYLGETECAARLAKVRALLEAESLDLALVYYDEFNIGNGWYLTGWCPQFESGAVLVREIVLAGARGTRAQREVAAQRLGELDGRTDVRAIVKAEMVTYQERRREFALLAARRLYPGEMLREVSDRAILDVHEPVREEAARALRDARTVAARPHPNRPLARPMRRHARMARRLQRYSL